MIKQNISCSVEFYFNLLLQFLVFLHCSFQEFFLAKDCLVLVLQCFKHSCLGVPKPHHFVLQLLDRRASNFCGVFVACSIDAAAIFGLYNQKQDRANVLKRCLADI